MHEERARAEQASDRQVLARGGTLQRVQHALAGVGGNRRNLEHPDAAARRHQHEIGEGAADIDTDAPGRRGRFRHAASLGEIRQDVGDLRARGGKRRDAALDPARRHAVARHRDAEAGRPVGRVAGHGHGNAADLGAPAATIDRIAAGAHAGDLAAKLVGVGDGFRRDSRQLPGQHLLDIVRALRRQQRQPRRRAVRRDALPDLGMNANRLRAADQMDIGDIEAGQHAQDHAVIHGGGEPLHHRRRGLHELIGRHEPADLPGLQAERIDAAGHPVGVAAAHQRGQQAMRSRLRRLEAARDLGEPQRLACSSQDLQHLDAADQRRIHRSEYLNGRFLY